jgi:translocation and assembly module TamB
VRRLPILLTACLLVLGVVVVPVALIGAAVFTEAGLKFVVRHIPQRFGSGPGAVRLTIAGVSGTLARGVHADRVEIDHELVHLKFEGIDGRVALAPLLLQTIRSPNASVHSALIEVKRRTHPGTPGPPPPFLPRWLLISAEHTTVDDAVLTVPNGVRLEATYITAAAVLRHRSIHFFQAQGNFGDARADAIGELAARDPLGIEAQGHIEWTPAGQPAWRVDGSARGDLNALNLTGHALSPFRADASGQALDLTSHWHIVGDANVENFDLRAWGISSPLGVTKARLALTWNGAGFSGRGKVDPTGLHAGAFDAEFDGSFAGRVLTATHMEARHPSGAHAVGSGTFAIVPDGPPRLDLSGSWDNFRWPLTGQEPFIKSAAGSFTLEGLLPYKVHAQGSASAAGLSARALEVTGRLGKDSFAFEPAELDVLEGHASLTGALAWAPRPSWSVAGQLIGINPAALRADLAGSVSGALAVSGRGFDPRGDLSVTVGNLSGKLRGARVSGAGSLSRTGGALSFDRVRVALGGTSLALDGRAGEQLDLRFTLASSDLGLLAPGSRGQLNATGTVRGTAADPAMVASAHASALSYEGFTLEHLDADIDFDTADRERATKVDARLKSLSYASHTIESAALTVNGPPSAYRVHAEAHAEGLALAAEAAGAYGHGTFQGQLTGLTLKGKDALDLALEHPADLTASAEHARVEWLCLAGTPGSMCADADWSREHWSATLMSNQLPLSALTAGMTPAVQYQGTVDLLLRAAGGAQLPVTGTLRAQLSDAVLSHRLVSKKIEHTRIGSGTVTASVTPSGLTVAAVLEDGEVGNIRARIDAERGTGAWPDMPLSGAVHAETSELGLLSLYFPDIDRAAGELHADINVAGTLGAPQLNGVVKLSGGELDLYQVNLGLRQVMLEAHLTDGGFDFSGNARAGSGSAAANGHLEWHKLLPFGKFHLEGTNLRVADTPEAQIDASPNLNFAIDGRRIEVTGTVAVPYAKIQPKDITNAVRTSSDEVIVGTTAPSPTERFEVMSTVTLTLGDKVSVDAGGLTGRLTGSVTIKSGYDAITRGTGELSVADGKYLAYARKLDIQRGRLIFTGGPIEDPGVDLRAQKEFPDVTAGVNVRGTLLSPRMSFFSDPPLPQSQIVSLILSGGSAQSTQTASNAALGQAAALAAAQVGSHVGMPDVSLETDPIANETSLVLGRYLTPRLYVSYGVSLTETLNTLKLRYTLGDHWVVRTELGTARGADLVFSITK